MDTSTRRAYGFMRAHAGYIVGRNAEGALHLARAEALLNRAESELVARVEWLDDDEPYDAGDLTAEEVADFATIRNLPEPKDAGFAGAGRP